MVCRILDLDDFITDGTKTQASSSVSEAACPTFRREPSYSSQGSLVSHSSGHDTVTSKESDGATQSQLPSVLRSRRGHPPRMEEKRVAFGEVSVVPVQRRSCASSIDDFDTMEVSEV
mmetsp:Transcript_62238/g.148519  ORF Transcript_62238/g.148519 Transcript_62238/m.148519 type:complete len:117 (+) Transcript_62238:126-476(+)